MVAMVVVRYPFGAHRVCHISAVFRSTKITARVKVVLVRTFLFVPMPIVIVIHMFFFRERNFKWVSGVSMKPSFSISWVVHMSSPVNRIPPEISGAP